MGDKGETGGSAQMLDEAVGVASVTQGARERAAEIRAQIDLQCLYLWRCLCLGSPYSFLLVGVGRRRGVRGWKNVSLGYFLGGIL